MKFPHFAQLIWDTLYFEEEVVEKNLAKVAPLYHAYNGGERVENRGFSGILMGTKLEEIAYLPFFWLLEIGVVRAIF